MHLNVMEIIQTKYILCVCINIYWILKKVFVFSVSSYVATIVQFFKYIALRVVEQLDDYRNVSHNNALGHVFDIKVSKDSSTSDSFTLNDHRPI